MSLDMLSLLTSICAVAIITFFYWLINLQPHKTTNKSRQNTINIKLDSAGRIVIGINTRSFVLKGCGDYFTIEFLD